MTAPTLNGYYAAYRQSATTETLNDLFGAIRVYVTSIVARHARSYSDSDREDLTSDIVTNVWTSLSKMRDPAVPLSSWVHSVAKRRIADAIRRSYRQPRLHGVDSIDDVGHRLTTAPVDIPSTVGDLPGNLTSNQIDLMQRFQAKPDYAALAAELGIRPATLRNRLARIHKKVSAARCVAA